MNQLFRFTKEDVVLIVAIVPFFLSWLWPFRHPPWSSFYQEFLAFFAILMFLIFIKLKTVRYSGFIAFLFFLALVPVFQLSFGLIFFSGDAWLCFFYLFVFFLSVLLGFNYSWFYGSSGRLTKALAYMFMLAAFLSSIIALRQWLGLAESDFEVHYAGSRPRANVGQPNHLATLLSFGIFSVLYLYEKRNIHGLSATFLVVFFILGVVVTQSRTPLLVGGTSIIFWLWKCRPVQSKISIGLLLFWYVFYVAGFFLLPMVAGEAGYSAQSVASRVGASGRLDIWSASVQMIFDSPLFGYGWGQIPVAQVSGASPYYISGILTYSHNLFIDIFLWNGVVLGGVICFFASIWLLRLANAVASGKEASVFLLIFAFIVHAMVEYPHAYAYFLFPIGMMLGILERFRVERQSVEVRCIQLSVVGRWLFVLVYILVLQLFLREYRYFEKNYFNRMISSAGVVGFEPEVLRGGVIFNSQLDALQDIRKFEPGRSDEILTLEEVLIITKRYPYLSNLYKSALLLGDKGRYLEAAKFIDLIRVMHGERSYELAKEQFQKYFEEKNNR